MMQQRMINAANAPQPVNAYSQAMEVSGGTRILFISGQGGVDADGSIPVTMEEQAELAWHNVGAQLTAAGMGFANLVKVTMIIRHESEILASRPARLAALGDHRPASTVIIGGLVNSAWKIEIEGIAYA